MPVIFDEILFDLELKRAAALDPAHRRPRRRRRSPGSRRSW